MHIPDCRNAMRFAQLIASTSKREFASDGAFTKPASIAHAVCQRHFAGDMHNLLELSVL